MKRILASLLLLLAGMVLGYFIRDWSMPFSPLQGVSIGGTSGGTLDDFETVNEELPTFIRSLEENGSDLLDARALVVPARQGEYDVWVYVSPLGGIQPDDIEAEVTDFIQRRFGELMDLRSEPNDQQWPPPSPFFPIDGVVIEKVILDKANHDDFLGDGSTVKVYQVATDEKVEAILSNERIRDGHIWISRPFDEKTTSALSFLSRSTAKTEGSQYITQLISSDDLRVSYVDLKQGTNASLWLFSTKLGLLVYIQVNT